MEVVEGVELGGIGVGHAGVGGGRPRPRADGPRERLLRLGASALSDPELLAVLLGTGIRGQPVVELSESLLAAGGGLKALVQQDPEELCDLPGLGPARAAQLLAALELGRRAQIAQEERPKLQTPQAIHEYLSPRLSALRREVFHVLCFNSRNVLLRDVRVAEGTMSSCPVDPREVFAAALASKATAIVLAHNHPSGDPTPSSPDVSLTLQLADGARLLGIKLLDHLVIGDGTYVSMLERGQLPSTASFGGRSWNSGGGS
jgi:DNA repair protein RadC